MAEAWLVHVLVFDLDDTLFPERDFVLGGFAAAGEWLRQSRGLNGFAETAEKLYYAGRRGTIFDEALSVMGIEATRDLVASLVHVYRAHEPKLSLFSDAREILDWSAPRFHLALITDGFAAVQARKIRALQLEQRVPCRVISDELGREYWKPSPEPYRRVMARYSGRGHDYVYVGDNPRKDFIGARQMGWRTIRVRRPAGEHSSYEPVAAEAAEVEITDLRELHTLLEQAAS